MGDNRNEQRKHEAPNKRERAKAARGRRKGADTQLDWSQFAWQEFAILTVAIASEGGRCSHRSYAGWRGVGVGHIS